MKTGDVLYHGLRLLVTIVFVLALITAPSMGIAVLVAATSIINTVGWVIDWGHEQRLRGQMDANEKETKLP